MNCVLCGAYIEAPPHARRKYCPECRVRIRAEQKHQGKIRQKERERAKDLEQQGKMTIQQVMILAKQAGMTYGQYVREHGV